MSELPPPPPWLAGLQARFGALLRTPLAAEGGTLRAAADAYDPELVAEIADASTARARLALYHEQVWARRFVAFQSELPRFAQVVGYWRFNALVTTRLLERPPADVDLGRAADGFAARLLAHLDPGAGADPDLRPLASLAHRPGLAPLADCDAHAGLARQALRVDEAVRRAVGTPWRPPWRPARGDLDRLLLTPRPLAPSVAVLREDWAVVHRGAPADPPPPFERLPGPRWWVSWRSEHAAAQRRVEPLFAALLVRAATQPLGAVLAALEARADRDALARAVPRWTEFALSEGLWAAEPP